ncbi:uncharacterized protein N7503_004441 [Penicillium pulvis]|uniref:uncharacterized protein n=1 Tax=Penicillium pulvis TaxID=1562058 RepID=UPI002547B30A|nr:uncharacterized protein N7503_004441 [Penicillium pulvis]KAJ5801991.1 hypothetical protein N7503_004441 [Penicillium pulvis]
MTSNALDEVISPDGGAQTEANYPPDAMLLDTLTAQKESGMSDSHFQVATKYIWFLPHAIYPADNCRLSPPPVSASRSLSSPGEPQQAIAHENWDIGLLYPHFNLDDYLDVSTSPNVLFSLPETHFHGSSGSDAVLTSISTNPIVAESKIKLIRDAFKMVHGPWTPTARNFQEEEEENLSAAYGMAIADEIVHECDIQPMRCSCPPLVRDRLLTMLVGASVSRESLRPTPAFPSCDTLGVLLRSSLFWMSKQDDTWVHIPTFDITTASTELVAGLIALGAIRASSRAIQKFGLAMHELLTVQLAKIMLRGCGRFRKSSYTPIRPCPDDEGEALETKWRAWVEQESFTRLIYHLLFHCGQESLIMSVAGPLHYTELSLRLPLTNSLWFASSAASWKTIFFSQFAEDPVHVSVFNCLADLSQLQSLPNIYDINITRLAVQYSISSLIQVYRKFQATVGYLQGVNSSEHILWKDSQRRWLIQALEELSHQFDLCPPRSKPSVSTLLLQQLLSLHLSVSIDQLECLAGKEGLEEAQSAYTMARQWVRSSECRKALWHAGQLLKLIRGLPMEVMTEFHATAIYHGGLCLWAYCMISTEEASDTGSSIKKTEETLLNGEETIATRDWIAHGRARPVLSTGEARESNNHLYALTLYSIRELLQICIRDIQRKYPASQDLPVTTENLCNLLHALEVASMGDS